MTFERIQSKRETNRTNIERALAILTSICTPLSFLAGVYGMNFDHMPVFPYSC